MQQKSAAYWSALTAPGAAWRYGVDILASDERTPLEDVTAYGLNASDRLVPSSSRVALDVHATTHRSFSLNLRNDDGRYLPGPTGYPSGGKGSQTATGLVWFNTRYRPWIDLRTGFASNGASVYDRTYLGVYALMDPEAQVQTVGSQMQLNLLDKSTLLSKPYLITNSTLPTYTSGGHTVGGYAAGSAFDSVMSDLATRAGVPSGKLAFVGSSLTLPADYAMQEGTEWWTHLKALAGSMAHVIFFDGAGNLRRIPDPLLTNAPSVWTFQPGPLSIISQVQRKTDMTKTYNHVVVIGSSSTTSTVRGEAQITDPSNPYHKNFIGDRVVYVGKDGKLNDMTPDPNIGTTAQANTVAQQQLARLVGQNETVTITARNIPPLEPYDRVTVQVNQAGLNLDFSVDKITWNLGHDNGGGMSLECSRWFAIN